MMKKTISLLLVTTSMISFANAQQADNPFEGPYVGGTIGINKYSLGDLSSVGGDTNEKVNGLTYGAVAGIRTEISNGILLGAEGFINENNANETYVGGLLPVDVDADISYGVDATLGFGTDNVLLYVMGGYGWNDITATDASGLTNASFSTSGEGIRLGGGVEFKMTKSLSVRLQSNWQDFDGDASVISANTGLILSF